MTARRRVENHHQLAAAAAKLARSSPEPQTVTGRIHESEEFALGYDCINDEDIAPAETPPKQRGSKRNKR